MYKINKEKQRAGGLHKNSASAVFVSMSDSASRPRRAQMRGTSFPRVPPCQLRPTLPRVQDGRRLLLAIGVITSPGLPFRRTFLRAALMRFEEPQIVQRFVVGCIMKNTSQIQQEILRHGDIVVTGKADETGAACVEKSFGWWALAVHAFPAASFLAKTDDDSLNLYGNLADILRARSLVASGRMLYVGWPQYASFLPEYNVPCGWSGGPNGALSRGGCNVCKNHHFCYVRGVSTGEPINASTRGPFVFATGALQVLSRPLAARTFTGPHAAEFVRRASLSRRERFPDERNHLPWAKPWWEPWECQFEDLTVREIWGDVGRCGAIWQPWECQDLTVREIWGDVGRCGEM